MNGIRCFCIDDANRPKEIPSSKWVKKEEKFGDLLIYEIILKASILDRIENKEKITLK